MSMLFNFRPLVINPELATRIGLNEAIVLQQVNYWINDKEQGVIHSGRRWVFNSYESWVKQFPFWSADTVKRAFTSLVKQGCLDVEQLNKSQHDRTNYYTINHDCELLNDAEQVPSSNGASCPDRQAQDALMDEVKNARSLMVTTTKTTTEIKNTGADADAPPPKRQKKSSFDPAGLKPENVSAEIWLDWIKFRREKRQPLTEITCAYQAKQLAGHQNADEVIRRSIAGGWQGLFPERVPNKPAISLAENEALTASQPPAVPWCTPSGDGTAEVFINQAAIERMKRGGYRQ